MNKRQNLTLIEMAAMLLVFALAAALCMCCFAKTELKSRETICCDRAMIQLQNAAEVLKHCNGDYAAAAQQHGGSWDGNQWRMDYGQYQIHAYPESIRSPYLEGARMEVIYQGYVLFAVDLRWQEVANEK